MFFNFVSKLLFFSKLFSIKSKLNFLLSIILVTLYLPLLGFKFKFILQLFFVFILSFIFFAFLIDKFSSLIGEVGLVFLVVFSILLFCFLLILYLLSFKFDSFKSKLSNLFFMFFILFNFVFSLLILVLCEFLFFLMLLYFKIDK